MFIELCNKKRKRDRFWGVKRGGVITLGWGGRGWGPERGGVVAVCVRWRTDYFCSRPGLCVCRKV